VLKHDRIWITTLHHRQPHCDRNSARFHEESSLFGK